MARPNNGKAIQLRIDGLREAIAAFQALPDETREALLSATETTVSEIARGAQVRLRSSPSIMTRTLVNAVGWTVNRRSGLGRVGIRATSTVMRNAQMGAIGRNTVRVKGTVIPGRNGSALTSQGARIIRPTKYGHLVEFGHRKGAGRGAAAPEPFMKPAAKAEEANYLDRIRRSGPDIERRMGKYGGGRHL